MKTYGHVEFLKQNPLVDLPSDFDVVAGEESFPGSIEKFTRRVDLISRFAEGISSTIHEEDPEKGVLHVRGYSVPPKLRTIGLAIDAAVEDLKKNPDGVHVIKVKL